MTADLGVELWGRAIDPQAGTLGWRGQLWEKGQSHSVRGVAMG